jgi:hypothetical protein
MMGPFRTLFENLQLGGNREDINLETRGIDGHGREPAYRICPDLRIRR